MRKALATIIVVEIITLITLIGFFYRRYMPKGVNDLRETIYVVIKDSFWSGCEYDPENEQNCHEYRIKQLNDGADEWFKHFDKTARPKITIVYSEADVPFNSVNDPIHVEIEKDYCGFNLVTTRTTAACYTYQTGFITFVSSEDITPAIFSHELGHAMGRGHRDTPENIYSQMSYTSTTDHVLPIDIKILCKMYPECPPHEDTWCQGGFWDKDRCPSSSYEEGEEIFKANHPVP